MDDLRLSVRNTRRTRNAREPLFGHPLKPACGAVTANPSNAGVSALREPRFEHRSILHSCIAQKTRLCPSRQCHATNFVEVAAEGPCIARRLIIIVSTGTTDCVELLNYRRILRANPQSRGVNRSCQ